jgi:hypothetical protein
MRRSRCRTVVALAPILVAVLLGACGPAGEGRPAPTSRPAGPDRLRDAGEWTAIANPTRGAPTTTRAGGRAPALHLVPDLPVVQESGHGPPSATGCGYGFEPTGSACSSSPASYRPSAASTPLAMTGWLDPRRRVHLPSASLLDPSSEVVASFGDGEVTVRRVLKNAPDQRPTDPAAGRGRP